MKPLLIIISAPSGTGKTTLCDRLQRDYPEITYSVSCTTRLPRGEEEHGADYFFMDTTEFERRLRANQFMEHAIVHGNRYGTLREPVEEAMSEGQSVLMDIDVAGAAQVREFVAKLPEDNIMRQGFVDIFIRPPSIEVLRERLLGRAEDDEETIALRLENAAGEMARAKEYNYQIVNDKLEDACMELDEIILYASTKVRRNLF